MLIDLVQARKGLHEKCAELFHDEKIAKSIYMYLCDGIEECDAQPERKKGKWTHYERGLFVGSKCSQCDELVKFQTEYCPHCGAEMER